MHILQKEILVTPRWDNMRNSSSVQDIIINFLGFIPFALALNAVLMYASRWSAKKRALLTLLICFTISLTIEVIQSQIPSRSSQLIDLILNTIGPGVGLLVFGRFPARRHTR